MGIALMNEKVLFQKNAVVTDFIGNHQNSWEDYYSCFATIGGEGLQARRSRKLLNGCGGCFHDCYGPVLRECCSDYEHRIQGEV